MADREVWTLDALAQALAGSAQAAAGDLSVEVVEDADALRIVMHSQGDLDLLLSVSGEQIMVSVVLVPAEEITDRAAFERSALRINKLIPLSTFGIVEIDGEEHYELFGSLSAASSLDVIIEEIETLAANAIDAAALIAQSRKAA